MFSMSAIAQGNRIQFSNAKPFDENRYSEINKSPYFFSDWVKGTIYDIHKVEYKDVWLNYNGYEKEIEVYNEGEFIQLSTRDYFKVVVNTSDNPKVFQSEEAFTYVFMRFFHHSFADEFIIVLYEGEKVRFGRNYIVKVAEVVTEDVGQRRVLKNFVERNVYYMMIDGEIQPVTLKAKSIVSALPNTKVAESIVKEQRLKLKDEQEVIKFLKTYEERAK